MTICPWPRSNDVIFVKKCSDNIYRNHAIHICQSCPPNNQGQGGRIGLSFVLAPYRKGVNVGPGGLRASNYLFPKRRHPPSLGPHATAVHRREKMCWIHISGSETSVCRDRLVRGFPCNTFNFRTMTPDHRVVTTGPI